MGRRARQDKTREESMNKTGLVAAIALAASLASPAMAQSTNLSIVTGGTGGVYYPLGGGIANVLSKHVPGWQATAEVTGGSVDNLKLIGSRKADVALTMVDASLDALRGEDKFKGNKVPHQALMVLYPNNIHVVTIDGTGITKMADLKGKRVSTGSPGSATEVMAFRVIEAAGLDKDKDMKRERLGVAESTNAMKDKKIDAYFWVGGLPTAAVTDLAATPNTKIRLIDTAHLVSKMNEKYGPIYSANIIPKATYPGMEADNKIAVVWNTLVAHEGMKDDVAYTIVKTIFDRQAELIAVHGEAKNFRLENQSKTNALIPYHPGAIKYFAEKGVNLR
jgi:TRAP transporter TAXI family solute receptor